MTEEPDEDGYDFDDVDFDDDDFGSCLSCGCDLLDEYEFQTGYCNGCDAARWV